MISITESNSFFSKKVNIKKKFYNKELYLLQYFRQKTKIYPENVIVLRNFIFFFVKNENYFKAKRYLKAIRKQLRSKILIIRAENTLIKLLFSFFPDLYIHDIKLDIIEKNNGRTIINVCFLTYEERGIAIGRNGDYIKAINVIFEKYITSENDRFPILIKCEIIDF